MKKLFSLFLPILLTLAAAAQTTITPINVGTSPNDGTGDTLRAAFIKDNQNTSNLLNFKLETNNPTFSGSLSGPTANIATVNAGSGGITSGGSISTIGTAVLSLSGAGTLSGSSLSLFSPTRHWHILELTPAAPTGVGAPASFVQIDSPLNAFGFRGTNYSDGSGYEWLHSDGSVSFDKGGTTNHFTGTFEGAYDGSFTGAASFTNLTAPGPGSSDEQFGAFASTSGSSATAVGNHASAGTSSFAAGQGATASGSSGVAVGASANAVNASVAVGSFSSSLGSDVAVGNSTIASGNLATVVGSGASGISNSVTVVGNGASASGDFDTVIGQGSAANHTNDTVIGVGVSDTGPNQFILGRLDQIVILPGALYSSNSFNHTWLAMDTNHLIMMGSNNAALGSIDAARGNITLGNNTGPNKGILTATEVLANTITTNPAAGANSISIVTAALNASGSFEVGQTFTVDGDTIHEGQTEMQDVATFDSGSVLVGGAQMDEAIFPRHAVTLANGNNSDIAILGNTFNEITGPSGAFASLGIANTTDGKWIVLVNQTSQIWTIANESSSESTAANRIRTLTGGDIILYGSCTAYFWYSGNASRWIYGGSTLQPHAGNRKTAAATTQLSQVAGTFQNNTLIPIEARVLIRSESGAVQASFNGQNISGGATITTLNFPMYYLLQPSDTLTIGGASTFTADCYTNAY